MPCIRKALSMGNISRRHVWNFVLHQIQLVTFHGSLSKIFWRYSEAFSRVLSCSSCTLTKIDLLFFGTLGFFSLFSFPSFVA